MSGRENMVISGKEGRLGWEREYTLRNMMTPDTVVVAAKAYRKSTTGTEDGWAEDEYAVSVALQAAVEHCRNKIRS